MQGVFSLHQLAHSHNTHVYGIPVYLDPGSAQAKAAGRK